MDAMEYAMHATERAGQLHDLRDLDHRALAAMDDKALATWQTGFSSDSPQWRLGEHEWQCRLMARQIAAMDRSARRTLWGALGGAVLGFSGSILVTFVNWWVGHH